MLFKLTDLHTQFDDQRFGTTATTQPGDPHKLESHPEAAKKDHTIISQVLNPGHDKWVVIAMFVIAER